MVSLSSFTSIHIPILYNEQGHNCPNYIRSNILRGETGRNRQAKNSEKKEKGKKGMKEK
jgi:hypothetical protein